jgi:hypothetical protein
MRMLVGVLQSATLGALCLLALGCQTTHAPDGPEHEAPGGTGAPTAGSSGQGDDPANPGGDSGRGGSGGRNGSAGASGGPATPVPVVPGTRQELSLSGGDQAALDALERELAELEGLTAGQLLDRHPLTYVTELGYDPSTAQYLDLIQASELALDDAELAKLGEQGFVIVPRRAFPHMAYGYKTIYAADLPVYVSLDSILDAVHLSYDAILKDVELAGLIPDLRALLQDARDRLERGVVSDERTAADVDLFLTVALRLLDDGAAEPVAGGDRTQIADILAKAQAASGILRLELFGVRRELDFSQFEPRGHYTDSEELERYFRAMIWLGRTDFRMIETEEDGSQLFHRRQFDSVLALRDLVAGPARDAYARIDAAVTAFVGEHDYMQLSEVDALLADLGVSSTAEAGALTDAEIARTIVERGYGAQRIASQVIFKDPSAPPGALPLDRSFALLGQRYVVDSHVFSNVVYDRVPGNDKGEIRHLPDPLDAAYAALGNASALPLLESGLAQHAYAPHLERMRVLVDAHGDEFWGENLYNLWLSTLRAVSPAEGVQNPAGAGMPQVTGSEPWARRMLNTQLGSWAELRHDTILYAKQSYTTGVSCEFPDAYVDPYPEAFARIARYAAHGSDMADVLASGPAATLLTGIRAYFAELESVAAILQEMAEYQRSGTPFNDAQLAFINDAVRSQILGCDGSATYEGWYARLLYRRDDTEMDPTIADVHTHPGDLPPPAVLHVGTGLPRLMVVTTDTCTGPRAYAGLAFAYHEVVTGLDRLTDEEWAPMAATAEDVAWMRDVLP